MIRYQKNLLLLLLLFVCCLWGMPMQVKAGNTFTHTHTEECTQVEMVYCNLTDQHSSYGSHELITRHCTYCLAQTLHSHYLTTYVCNLTGFSKTTEGTTACLTCHNPGYAWKAPDSFMHKREEVSYSCGVNEAEVVAKVTLSCDKTNLTNQDVVLNAGVELIHGQLAGGSFSYSWDGSTWSSGTSKTVAENGTYTVWIKNAAGAVADASVTVSNIDKKAPVIRGIVHDENGMTREKISIAVSASDENGIAGYSFDGGSTWQESGTGWILAGKTYTVMVKDSAGNTASQAVKREQFPYPYVQSVTTPSANTNANANNASDTNSSVQSSQSSIAVEKTQKADQNTKTKKTTDSETKEDNKSKESSSNEPAGAVSGKSNNTGLVPKVVIAPESVAQSSVNSHTFKDNRNLESGKENTALTEANDNSEGGEKVEMQQDVVQIPEKKGISILSMVVAGMICIATGSCYFLYIIKTGVLYGMDDEEGEPYFRRLKRIRIQKTERGYEAILPKNLYQSGCNGHFRILLSDKWVKEGKNKQIFIYNGRRKLVADMEECIDFVL